MTDLAWAAVPAAYLPEGKMPVAVGSDSEARFFALSQSSGMERGAPSETEIWGLNHLSEKRSLTTFF